MAVTTEDRITARLDRLERESRRWKRAALGSWLAIAALFLLGQSPPRTAKPNFHVPERCMRLSLPTLLLLAAFTSAAERTIVMDKAGEKSWVVVVKATYRVRSDGT